ncbi:MAG: hypothetical protein HY000_33840 [Planctomycetes bacterium]|nr:hypothetical protein [Planctomycetota bacterium]
MSEVAAKLKLELLKQHGEPQQARIERGIDQVVRLWRDEDGDHSAFANLVRDNFVSDQKKLDATFERFEYALEQLDGHFNEIGRELRHWSELDVGPMLPIDRLFAAYDPTAHVVEDLFANQAVFVVLLNFPLTTLEERLERGKSWTRRQWAEVRLAQRFSKRIPAAVNQQITKASADGDAYIAEYNVWMHHLINADGKRLFPSGLRLISHWNLRDELKANYADRENGLAKQQTIAKVMDRIVTQSIPRVAINNPRVDWNPYTNEVRPAPAETIEPNAPPTPLTGESGTQDESRKTEDEKQETKAGKARKGEFRAAREPDTRYAHLLATYHAARLADPYSPAAPTLIARRFDENRELPEDRVQRVFEEIMTSPLVPRVAKLIEQRLGRKLQPFDIWYNGFQPRGKYAEAELDAIVRKKYPEAAAFQADMPRLLVRLGFTPERAAYLPDKIAVDPSRGAGHAMPALRRGDKPRLRTRIEQGGMNYKGYNIAVHEMGHNVEQVFSLYHVDHTLLTGVPNNAFTEALAFVFQGRDLELLGLEKPDVDSERMRVLNSFWMTYEIIGPALVDMAVWHWMYDHPDATPAELREATLAISKDIWNRYYAPVFGARDVVLLGVYSHMVSLMMYLPDYPLGHLIEFQIEEHMSKSGKPLGEEFERMASFGSVLPDLWMEHATGSPVSVEPLLRATERALK